MRTILLVACLLYSVYLFSIDLNRNYIFYNLNRKGQLTFSSVRDITQDQDGYIWIGTLKGLNRYDGYNVEHYYRGESGLVSNVINKIIPLTNDSILIGTDKGLCCYNKRLETFSAISVDDCCGVNDMYRHLSSIYIASDLGLFVYDCEKKNYV